MAFVLFCIVKAMNKLMELGHHAAPAEEAAPEPAPAPEPTAEEKLLAEIRDLLKSQQAGCQE